MEGVEFNKTAISPIINKDKRKHYKAIAEQRLGESRVMSCGEIASIVKYVNCNDITVQFVKTGELVKANYYRFEKGSIKSHFTPTVFGVGVTGLEQTRDDNDKMLDSYSGWISMIKRCYSDISRKDNLSYVDCKVCDEWLYYPNFKKWYHENYYEIYGKNMELDKDIISKGNKMYSPDNCVFVPHDINNLFTKVDRARGKYPIGVNFRHKTNKYEAKCRNNGKSIALGTYNTEEDAFMVYKQYKELLIKNIAEKYKAKIPAKLYNAMVCYSVEISD